MNNSALPQVDLERCDGCGACVAPYAEGAIEMVNGKARVVREELCDGVWKSC